ncbi:MAG TPA: CGNR zinc finger domain-containing protein [Propionibacteriaceae bacterium]|nr:CGNR zinc finger domain-containing protein [Propionibacteriaceae bacterium]HPZ49226.1 CGNR zinc finger domain-containing protein [Propionibacteriaceae bacterium]HQE30883.1 CGNR zinc finger domain-containing protein [Propionibacteriaceae bacterium]
MTGLLVDLSKNRSRKFCDTACANRAHAAAYRARQRGWPTVGAPAVLD